MISRLALLIALVALGVASLALFVATRSDDAGAGGESPDVETVAEDAQADESTESTVEPSNDTPATSASHRAASSGEDRDDTDSATPAPTSRLPGEPFEFGPAEGAVLSVVGVSHDDALNLRDSPFGEIIATLSNDVGPDGDLLVVRAVPSGETIARIDLYADGAIASGSSRRLPTTTWHEVTVGGVRGWASADYLAPLGTTYDMTGEVVETAGEPLTAPTMTELATKVVDALTSGGEEPPEVSVALAPGVFEGLGEIDVDVLGLADDSLRGYRLYVSADYLGDWTQQDDPGLFTLRSVGARWICDTYRGTSPEGLCQ